MSVYILLGLLNGVCIALSRILNGQLSLHRGAFHSSYVNHLVGFGFLSLMMLCLFSPPDLHHTNLFVYTGGAIGAFYVAVNSLVMIKLGSTNSIILVVAGQMLTSLFIDYLIGVPQELLLQIIGVSLIVAGIACKEFVRKRA